MKRRAFLKAGAASVAGLLAAGTEHRAHAQDPPKTKLVLIKRDDAADDEGQGRPDVVRRMVDGAVLELTGKRDRAEAWRSLVAPDDVVGIKVNLRGGPYLSVQPCTVDAVIAGLTAAGVNENNIIVWDAWTKEFAPAGFTVNTSAKGVRYFAVDGGNLSAGRKEDRRAFRDRFSTDPVTVADKSVYFAKILSDEVTALINMPLIKDHSIAGVTCAMKNHYGSIFNPNDLHGNACDPYLAALNAAPVVRDKTRLILVDGLRALYHGGPRDNPRCRWVEKCIIAGKDPVAIDALALRIVEDKRAEMGKDPIAAKAHYIASAASMGLGVNDFAKIDLVRPEIRP